MLFKTLLAFTIAGFLGMVMIVGCGEKSPAPTVQKKAKKTVSPKVARKDEPEKKKPFVNPIVIPKDGEAEAIPEQKTKPPIPNSGPGRKSEPNPKPEKPEEPKQSGYRSRVWVGALLPPYGFRGSLFMDLQGEKKVTVDPIKDFYYVQADYQGKSSDKTEDFGSRKLSYDYSPFSFKISAKRVSENEAKKSLEEMSKQLELLSKKGGIMLSRGYLKLRWVDGKWLFTMAMSSDEADVIMDDMENIARSIARKIISQNRKKNLTQ